MTVKELFAKVFTKGALRVIEYLAFGGFITYQFTGGINKISDKIRDNNQAMETRIIQHTYTRDSAMRSAILMLTDVVEGLDSTVNKTSDKEKQYLRRENWQLRKERYNLLNDDLKKNSTSYLNKLNLCPQRLILSQNL